MKPLDPTTESRPLFPALTAHPNFVFADSAGGSAILQPSIAKIESYYRDSNVQIGGSYGASALCTQRIREAAQTTAELLNAESPDEVCFVSSTTQGLENLAYALEATFKPGDEIIVTDTEHEGISTFHVNVNFSECWSLGQAWKSAESHCTHLASGYFDVYASIIIT
jgi:selenocysteine lyase/cysteine desulfurase